MLQLFRGLLRPLSLRLSQPFGITSGLNNENRESKLLKDHLLRYHNGADSKLNIDIVLSGITGKYFSHPLLHFVLEKYEKNATPAQIEQLSKRILREHTGTPERRIMASIVGRYERRPDELLGWKDLDSTPNKLAMLRIFYIMKSIPRKQLMEYMGKLNLQTEPMDVLLYICAIYNKLRETRVDLSDRIHAYSEQLKSAGSLSEDKMAVVHEFFRLDQSWTIVSRSTFENFRVSLENNLKLVSRERMPELLGFINRMPVNLAPQFQALIRFTEQQALRTQELYLQNKAFALLERANMHSKHLIPDMIQHPQKYATIARSTRSNNYIIQEHRRIGQKVPENFMRVSLMEALREIESTFKKGPQDRQGVLLLDNAFRFLLSCRKELNQLVIRQLKQLYFSHLFKADLLPLFLLKLMFLLYCEIQDFDNALLINNQIKKLVQPHDIDVLVEVWYNIKRLKLKMDLPYKVTDCVLKEPIKGESVSKLFYCLQGEEQQQVNTLVLRLQADIQRILKQERIHLKTLFLMLQVLSAVPGLSKFIFVHLQTKLMETWKHQPIEEKDLKFVRTHFEKANAGSRKLHTFLNQSLREPTATKKHLQEYLQREKKFSQLREKQRVDKIQTRRLTAIQEKRQH